MAPVPRPLPSHRDAAAILARKRTRPAGWTPPAAGRALATTLKALEQRFGHGLQGLQARWREIVGATLARRSEPVKLVKSGAGPAALEIRVDGPSAALIQHQSGEIIARVNLFLGAGSVGRLRIVQGPLRGPVRAAAARPPARRRAGPLDAAAEDALAQSLSALPDGRLRAALAGLGREVLRRR
jgi:hypothetical protein